MRNDYIEWAGEAYARFACVLNDAPDEESFLDYFWMLSGMY